MSPETPDFAATAQSLAEAVCGVFPDLTFTKGEDATVTILAGGLKLVVAPIPAAAEDAPEALNEGLGYPAHLTQAVDALIRQYGYEGKLPAAAYPPRVPQVNQANCVSQLDYWYAVADKLHPKPQGSVLTLNEETESLSAFAMPQRGSYPGEKNFVRHAGHAGARAAFRRDAAINQDVDALQHMDFDAVPAGGLQAIEYRALCKARLRAQNAKYARPGDPEAEAAYQALHERWVAENEAHRAQDPGLNAPAAFQHPLGLKGYEGD